MGQLHLFMPIQSSFMGREICLEKYKYLRQENYKIIWKLLDYCSFDALCENAKQLLLY